MFFKAFAVVLSLVGAVTPYPGVKRTNDIKIYAYGTGISGLQVYGGVDGKAYIAAEATSNLTELTWQSPEMYTPWNATLENTKNLASFYIVTGSDSFEQCGFKDKNATVPSNAQFMGFTKYGSQIMWVNGSDYQSLFWAQETDTEGLYKLHWNADNADRDDSVPVTIKTV